MADGAGFGVSVTTFKDGVVDIDPVGGTISGDMIAVEGVARRLMTPRGFFWRWPDYGFDLRARLGVLLTAFVLARLRAEIERECLKEEAVLAASKDSIEITGAGFSWTVRIQLQLSSGTKLTTTLGVNEVSVRVLKVLHG